VLANIGSDFRKSGCKGRKEKRGRKGQREEGTEGGRKGDGGRKREERERREGEKGGKEERGGREGEVSIIIVITETVPNPNCQNLKHKFVFECPKLK